MEELKGKSALITGGSRGVGFATAVELVRRGAKVAITARTRERLEDSRRKLAEMGGEAVSIVGDVGKKDDAERMVSEAVDRFGRLDILVNNAGVSMRGRFAELSAEVCERVIDTNLVGSILLSRAAVKHIIQTRGHIVFISSIAGLFGLPGASIYCASKGALSGLCDSLRIELMPLGVHVGIVYLGYTEHDPEKRILDAEGTPLPPDRPAHHTQKYAADLILRLIEKRKRRLIMTPIGNLGALVHRLSPGLVEMAVLKAQSSQWKIFKRFS